MMFGGIGRPGFRRVGRPGLIGLAARTAVVAGTASATIGAVNRHQAKRAQESYEADQYEQQAQAVEEAAPLPVPSPSNSPGLVNRIKELSDLHAAGALSDTEFALSLIHI